jgi:hypothetical protein
MGAFVNSIPYSTGLGFREVFHFLSIPADKRAMTIAADAYFNATKPLATVAGYMTALSVMPITSTVVARSGSNHGNASGLGSSTVPALWLVESPIWVNAADDAAVLAAHAEANRQIKENLKDAVIQTRRFFYLSDAEKTQASDIFPSYGQGNLQRLKQIRNRYDPAMVFTKLVPGGAKIAYAS